ncbi:MAG: hypothetical protein NWE94_04370 [Candidatus Bathyarchaeota archaeon]|nr:hypothetical protein [Candidatus Bathyarchaeota archaeon]
MPYKDECGICGRVLSGYRLKKCERCKKLFCRDCMVADVATGDPTHLLCLNCASHVVSPRPVSKYGGLANHLKFRGAFTKLVKLSFARIDGLIGSNLSMDAYREEAWWSNSSSSAHAKAWLDVGWEVQEVNLKEGYTVFKKVRDVPFKRKKRKSEIKKPFTPVHVRSAKPKVPSKTKVSKLYARIKNLERQRTARSYIRGFKPKSQHEKKLFKSNEKPQ